MSAGCAPTFIKTYEGPALSKHEICVIDTIKRKPDHTPYSKGQKILKAIIIAPSIEEHLFISEIDGIGLFLPESPMDWGYYELPSGKHNIELKIQQEQTHHWGKTKKTYSTLSFSKTIDFDCESEHIYFLDFTLNKGNFNIISKDVTNDSKYKKIINNR
jgi:hypothetical protein